MNELLKNYNIAGDTDISDWETLAQTEVDQSAELDRGTPKTTKYNDGTYNLVYSTAGDRITAGGSQKHFNGLIDPKESVAIFGQKGNNYISVFYNNGFIEIREDDGKNTSSTIRTIRDVDEKLQKFMEGGVEIGKPFTKVFDKVLGVAIEYPKNDDTDVNKAINARNPIEEFKQRVNSVATFDESTGQFVLGQFE